MPQVFDRSGNAPAFAPEHMFTLWTARDFDQLTLSASARYTGSQFIAQDNDYEIDGAFTADLSAAYRLQKTTLQLNLKNVTNSEYETRGFGTASVIPATPFTFSIGLGWSL